MTLARSLLTVTLVATAIRAAQADRYETSIRVQPTGGVAWVGDPGVSQRVSVPSVGLAIGATYGVRNWLAIEAELGGAMLGTARFTAVPVTIDGGSPTVADLERSTRTARLTTAATLRLGVAWIPTVTLGLGFQGRWMSSGHVVDTDLVADGRAAGVSADLLVLVRAGLDRRINRRFIIGAQVGASRAMRLPAIDCVEGMLALSYYWYPSW